MKQRTAESSSWLDSTASGLLAKREWYGPPKQMTLLTVLLAACTGCQVIGIPSYRADYPSIGVSETCVGGCPPGVYAAGDVDGSCQPGLMPPLPALPGRLAQWRMKRQQEKTLPSAPEFPRYHPLPTRPLFSPRPGGGDIQPGEGAIRYGQMSPQDVGGIEMVSPPVGVR